MKSILLTGGCSFSECISDHVYTWPRHLAKILPDREHISTAIMSQGNGLISKQIIYKVTQLLKTHSSDELLVGIMWSGPNRHEFYTMRDVTIEKEEGCIESIQNPTSVVDSSDDYDNKKWVILNHFFKNDYTKHHFFYFYDHIGSLVNTCEHVLRTQWFLKMNNIKYFMAAYTDQVFPLAQHGVLHPEVKHLYDMIDFDHFVTMQGEYDWCLEKFGMDSFPTPGDNHPTTEHHKAFTEQVIVPHLKDKGYI